MPLTGFLAEPDNQENLGKSSEEMGYALTSFIHLIYVCPWRL